MNKKIVKNREAVCTGNSRPLCRPLSKIEIINF